MYARNSTQSETTIYAFSHCETWLEDYAKSHQLPLYELTERVANLLLLQTSGKILGASNSMPTLRSKAAKRSKTARKMAVVKRTHRKTSQLKKRFYKKLTNKQLRAMRKNSILARAARLKNVYSAKKAA